jgi:hypothetical protein
MIQDQVESTPNEDWETYSLRKVELLRGLREELATRRWELILEIDVVRDLLSAGTQKCFDPDLERILQRSLEKLEEVKQNLARIPDDFIPSF